VTSGVYIIQNLTNRRIYVGSSFHAEVRWTEHQWHLRNGSHDNGHLQAAWFKYGPDVFQFLIIEECAREVLTEREQWWIDWLGAADRETGYNIAKNVIAPMLGRKHKPESIAKMTAHHIGAKRSPESCARMSEAQLRNQKPVSDETRAKMSAAHTGQKHSEETIAQMRIAHSGFRHTEEFKASRRGVKFTDEHRANISAAKKGRPGRKLTDTEKANLRASNLGRKHTAEARAKMSAGQFRRQARERAAGPTLLSN